MHSYVTAKELKKKAFIIKNQNIKQRVGIQVTFILEIKLGKKKGFLAKCDSFFGDLCIHFEHLLGL